MHAEIHVFPNPQSQKNVQFCAFKFFIYSVHPLLAGTLVDTKGWTIGIFKLNLHLNNHRYFKIKSG